MLPLFFTLRASAFAGSQGDAVVVGRGRYVTPLRILSLRLGGFEGLKDLGALGALGDFDGSENLCDWDDAYGWGRVLSFFVGGSVFGGWTSV